MNRIQNNFNRFASSYNFSAIIQQEIAKRLFSRLEVINPQATSILELGAGTGFLTKKLLKKYNKNQVFSTDFASNTLKINLAKNKICLDSHSLPFKNNSFDVVISNLMMQWCDFDIITIQALKVLKNNGLFIFSTFGPQTLIELKQSWQGVDKNIHISDFSDMHNIGDKLLTLGLNGVVMEGEIIILTYEKVMDLLTDLKNIGAQNINPKPINKTKLKQMITNYEQLRINGKLPASYEAIYAHSWKSQSAESIKINTKLL